METTKYTFGEVRAFASDVEKTRTVEFVISSNTKDRHGTVLPADKWNLDCFNANGIVGYQHNVYGGDLCNAPDPDDVIGIGRAWIEGDKVIGSVTFEPAEINPKAEKIFRKVLNGTLKATSVGFNPTAPGYFGQGEESERGSNPTYYYNGQELLEFSIVNIPSNPDALRRSMRDQASNAIGYIYRQLGGKVRFSDIEKMTVGDVIAQLETRSAKSHPELVSGSDEQRGLSVKVEVEVEIDKPDGDNTPDNPDQPDPENDPTQPETDTLIQQRESDQDLILITKSKLALTANS